MSQKRCWAFAVLGITGFLSSFGDCYIDNKCYCWDELDATLKSKLPTITPPQVFAMYQYVGVKPIAGGAFRSCVCNDVTRMRSPLKMEEEWIAERARSAASNSSLIQMLALNITQAFMSLLQVKNLTKPTLSVNVTFTSVPATPPQSSNWVLEVVMKGRSASPDNLETDIKYLTDNSDGTYTLQQVGKFLAEALAFVILKCSGEPPPAPFLGSRIWSNIHQFPGDIATYSCPQGYFLVESSQAFSICRHEDIVWSTPQVNLSCEQGCNGEPPDGIVFTIRKWKSSMRRENDMANYTCMNGYRSVTGRNGSSTCTNGQWTKVEQDFKCQQILCSLNIPQVPMYGMTDWDCSTRYISTKIIYTCKEEYSPTIKTQVSTTCDQEGNWTPLPPKYECLHKDLAIRLGLYDDQQIKAYDYYEDGPKKNQINVEQNWFLLVTIPAIVALVLTIICCLCCTRTDSPLFILCTGNTKNTSYIPPR